MAVRWRRIWNCCKKARCPRDTGFSGRLAGRGTRGCGLAAALFPRHAGIGDGTRRIVPHLVLFRRGVRHHLLVAGAGVRRAAADDTGNGDRLEPCGAIVGRGRVGIDLGLCRDLRGQQNRAHQTQSGHHSCC